MKHLKYIVFSLIIFSCFILNIKAECTYKEQANLNLLASKVKVAYEIIEVDNGDFGIPQPETDEESDNETEISDEIEENPEIVKLMDYGIKLTIRNITKDIYVIVKNKDTNETKTYFYNENNKGNVEQINNDANNTYDYEVSVYANINNCQAELLKTINITTPKFNDVSEYSMCDDFKTYTYCQQFIVSDLTVDEIIEKVDGYSKNKINDEEQKSDDVKEKDDVSFYDKYTKEIWITTGAIVLVGIVVTIILIKKKGKSVI